MLPQGVLVLRRRSGWEAADSGLLLWRENCAWFFLFFVLPLGSIALGLRLILPVLMRPWAYLILWWFKPLFDRFILHVIGIRFFEPQAGAGRLFRGLGKSLVRGLAGDLLWRRFSPWRAARMPIRTLENLRGRRLRNRGNVLGQGGLNFCAFLTLLGLILEGILLAGEAGFALIMIELFRPDLFSSIIESIINLEPFVFAAGCFNLALVESLYVCMGFGLYINSRVEVEGWDIQLLFRNFAEAKKKKAVLRGAAPVSIILMMILLLPLKGYAETKGPPPDTEAPALEILQEILNAPDFGGEKEGWGIRFKERKERREWPDFSSLPQLEKIKLAMGYILRSLVILSIAALGIFSLRRLYILGRKKGWVTSRDSPGKDSAKTGGIIPPTRQSPAFLLDQAQDLYLGGRIREAWAACFAGAIAAYTRRRGVFFPPDATEYDCLALVRALDAEAAGEGGFAGLVLHWIDLAYRGVPPGMGTFEAALAFCRSLDAPGAAGEPSHG
jgi:hypothetical protein